MTTEDEKNWSFGFSHNFGKKSLKVLPQLFLYVLSEYITYYAEYFLPLLQFLRQDD